MVDSKDDALIRDLLSSGKVPEAVEGAIRLYGPELLGFIAALVRDHDVAGDVFSEACEDVWRGLAGFRGASSLRTWLYTVTRHACSRYFDNGYQRGRRPLSAADRLDEVQAQVRTQTLTYLRTETRSAVQRLRDGLTPEQQTLLILRVDRQLSWNDIACIVSDGELDEEGIKREAAACRKRFERAMDRLKDLAKQAGLVKE